VKPTYDNSTYDNSCQISRVGVRLSYNKEKTNLKNRKKKCRGAT
jgi:hypothetical protein